MKKECVHSMDPAQALEAQEIARNRIINETIELGDSPVQQFYAGAVVLLTGGSGFLGKQLLEKLFRSCRIKRVYILLRPKKQRTIQERLTKMLEDQAYDYLRETQPDFVDKIVAVGGDVSLPRLGVSDEDRNIITEEVTILIHGAATINFTEPLRIAAMTNVHGTQEMLRLAKECKKLRSFVHISTAYSHATFDRAWQPVLEQFYDCPMSPDALFHVVQNMNDDQLDILTPQIIKGWPNTYAFTKAVAEKAVLSMAGDLPICIVRPSVVICAYREPLPGWLDKGAGFGASGLVVGAGLGVIHVLYANSESILDLVPVDLVNNAVILAAQETAVRHDRGDNDVRIYTVSSYRKPITFSKIVELITYKGSKYVTMSALWYAYAFTVQNKLLYQLLFFLMHSLPGFLVDAILLMLGKKPIFRLTKIYQKAYKAIDVLGYYTTRTFKFGDSNLRQLYWSQSPADRTVFNCDTDSIDWPLYLCLWIIGCRKYIVRDGLKDTKKAMKMQFIFRILNYIVLIGLFYLIYKTILGFFVLWSNK